MTIIITKGFKSSILNKHIDATPMNEDGIPKYTINLDAERANELIEAGVAMEYVLESEMETEDIGSNEPEDAELTEEEEGESSEETESEVIEGTNSNEPEESEPTESNNKKQNKNNKKK